MTTQAESGLTTATQSGADFDRILSERIESRLTRFERLAQKLFRVESCLVSLGNLAERFGRAESSLSACEGIFCDSLPLVQDTQVVPDLTQHPALAKHRLVAGAPYLRFYAATPLRGTKGDVIGNLVLFDYQPRALDEEQLFLLADLATMVERELVITEVYHAQVQLLKQNRLLKREMMLDPVLGTWNKESIVRSLRIEMERCAKAEKPMALILASIDQMPELRQVHGVAITDLVLVKSVSRIRSCIRPFDALGRFVNDELMIVLPGASHLVAAAVAERIKMSIMTHPDMIENAETALTLCAGVVSTDTYPQAEPDVLINLAEKALFSARTAGNNRVVLSMPEQPDIII